MPSHSSSSSVPIRNQEHPSQPFNKQKVGSNLGATRLVRLGSLLASFDEMMWSVALYDISLNKLLWTCKLPDMPEPAHHGFNDEKKNSIRISGNGVVAVCKNIIALPRVYCRCTVGFLKQVNAVAK